jgi:predicted kinase
MPIVHLIHGFLGVGKTTFARQLERATGAIRFSPDEVMSARHGIDPPAEHFAAHHAIILAELDSAWQALVRSGRDAILDYGFWKRAERDAIRSAVHAAGATHRLYSVFCDEATARARIQNRNTDLRGSLFIAPATYDLLKKHFEPLAPDEVHVPIETHVPLRHTRF